MGETGLHEMEAALDVDTQDTIEIGFRVIHERQVRCRERYAGRVIDEHIDPPEPLEGLGDRGIDLVSLAHVAGDRDYATALLRDFPRRCSTPIASRLGPRYPMPGTPAIGKPAPATCCG